jgi:hypothetical protein
MCPVALAPASWLRAAPEPPSVPSLQLPPPGSGQLRSHHMSYRALRAVNYWSKQISPDGLAIMISIGTCAYLPRRHTTRLVLCSCKTCGRRRIKW